jgi:hypothetical protein
MAYRYRASRSGATAGISSVFSDAQLAESGGTRTCAEILAVVWLPSTARTLLKPQVPPPAVGTASSSSRVADTT